jgi:hypothetical protein
VASRARIKELAPRKRLADRGDGPPLSRAEESELRGLTIFSPNPPPRPHTDDFPDIDANHYHPFRDKPMISGRMRVYELRDREEANLALDDKGPSLGDDGKDVPSLADDGKEVPSLAVDGKAGHSLPAKRQRRAQSLSRRQRPASPAVDGKDERYSRQIPALAR